MPCAVSYTRPRSGVYVNCRIARQSSCSNRSRTVTRFALHQVAASPHRYPRPRLLLIWVQSPRLGRYRCGRFGPLMMAGSVRVDHRANPKCRRSRPPFTPTAFQPVTGRPRRHPPPFNPSPVDRCRHLPPFNPSPVDLCRHLPPNLRRKQEGAIEVLLGWEVGRLSLRSFTWDSVTRVLSSRLATDHCHFTTDAAHGLSWPDSGVADRYWILTERYHRRRRQLRSMQL